MRIEDYALIGDCHTAALIGRDGSIDWLCMPRFDADSCFAALLGEPKHGRWLICPDRKVKPFKTRDTPHVTRSYRGDSLILETSFRTSTGEVKLIDFMPMRGADRTIVRIVEGVSGHVAMETELVIRFDYGITIPWVNRIDSKTILAVAGPHLLCVRSPVRIEGRNMHSAARFTVRKGERVPFVLSYRESHFEAPDVIDADIALEQTERHWAEWTATCRVQGKWRKQVMRSLLTLKSLSYKPTGGIVAAVTTSLPEQIGGARNWDYRYCWLRDATFTLLAFLNAGYTEEANVWQHWLMRVIAGAPDQLQTMYSVMGDRRLEEMEVAHLPGYEGSKPVRIGNAAAKQLQLDIFGELSDVATQARKGGLPPAPRRAEIRETFLAHLEKIWREPDEGIWEIRGTPQYFVHSKVMTWVAFDRAIQARPHDRHAAHYRKMAETIRADICAKGVDPKRGCFVQAYGSTRMDASLLLLPLVGFLPAHDKRIRRTVEEIEKRLIHKGLVLRYETETGIDGLPPGEGAFLACSFWLADNYVLMGRKKEAMRLFNRLKRYGNDVGLFAEEYDPSAKRMLGNFPQAFSHVALINTALNLMQEESRENEKTSRASKSAAARILAIDIGGTGLKAAVVDIKGRFLSERVRIKTPKHSSPKNVVPALVELVAPLKGYNHVSIGFPGYVRDGKVFTAANLGTKHWAGFPLARVIEKKLGKPTRLNNDADVQGLAVIKGKGLELVCTLGTGFGTAWFREGELMPHMELAHIPIHHGKDFDGYIGEDERRKIGDKEWNKRVKKIIPILATVMNYDHLYLGGGNSSRISFRLPRNVTLVSNDAGMEGSAFVWHPKGPRKPSRP